MNTKGARIRGELVTYALGALMSFLALGLAVERTAMFVLRSGTNRFVAALAITGVSWTLTYLIRFLLLPLLIASGGLNDKKVIAFVKSLPLWVIGIVLIALIVIFAGYGYLILSMNMLILPGILLAVSSNIWAWLLLGCVLTLFAALATLAGEWIAGK